MKKITMIAITLIISFIFTFATYPASVGFTATETPSQTDVGWNS